MRKLSLILGVLLLASAVQAGPKVSLIERIEADLAKDKAFSVAEREKYLAEFRQQLGAYAFDVLKGQRVKGAEVVMAIVMEGSFEQVPVARTVGIAASAYQAISRGAPPKLVEGIALYGFRKKLSSDKIAAWANGANDLIKFKVPRHVAKDLVYNAAENNWDIDTFNTFKWGLVQAKKKGHDVVAYATYLIGHYRIGKHRPGALLSKANRAFKHGTPKLPRYSSPCAPQKRKKPLIKLKPKAKAPLTAPPTPPPAHPKIALATVLSSLDRSVKSFLGTPYVWGGRTRRGTDCSGFTQTIFAEAGIGIPRNSRSQWKVGSKVPYQRLKRGDLVFFRTVANRISHVGVVTKPAEHEFVHASSSRGVVRSNLESKYYKKRYAGARRVIP
jgi:cell wall-associated NlpC family hydrolase